MTPAELAANHGVIPDDGVDDTAGLQAAIDYVRTVCSPGASFTKLSLPAGVTAVTSTSVTLAWDAATDNRGVTGYSVWLEFDLPAGTTAQNPFSSTMTRNGNHYTFLPVSHNTVIKAGASKEFGFTTVGLGRPFNCALNGNPCE